jgi:hypothetical protein
LFFVPFLPFPTYGFPFFCLPFFYEKRRGEFQKISDFLDSIQKRLTEPYKIKIKRFLALLKLKGASYGGSYPKSSILERELAVPKKSSICSFFSEKKRKG